MREIIIFAPGANAAELLRLLARHGKNQMCMRVFGSAQLAEHALMCSGITSEEKYISGEEEASVIYSIASQTEYFSSASFSDASQIAQAIRSLRMLITENEASCLHETLSRGAFQDKNSALLKIYDSYISLCAQENFIDSIGLLRKAIAEASVLDADFITLEEYPLTPLEKRLAEVLSGGNISHSDIRRLIGAENNKIHISDYTEAYGASNEAENIIGRIFENNLALDSCIVAVTNASKYSQLFYEISGRYNIPVTFGCGIPISNTNPARLLRLFLDWDTSGYNGIDALRALIFSDFFDRKKLCELLPVNENYSARTLLDKAIAAAGSLRLSCSTEANRKRIEACRVRQNIEAEAMMFIECAELIFREFEKGCAYIIGNYSVIRRGNASKADHAAVNTICDELNAYCKFSGKASVNEIIPEILAKAICAENCREGCLHITKIGSAGVSLRENLFVVGLSASEFPGSPTENYLVLDDDYLLFGENGAKLTSGSRIAQNKTRLDFLLRIASALGNSIYLSYSGYNLAELKEENASSVLFEIYKAENGEGSDIGSFESSVRHTGFFSQRLSPSRLIGEAYNQGKEILTSCPEQTTPTISVCISKEQSFSPTSIESFFSCPRKFFLTKILGISEPQSDNPFEIIGGGDFGTLVHKMMELRTRNDVTLEEFLSRGDTLFNDFLAMRPPMHSSEVSKIRKEFLSVLSNAYTYDPGNEVVSSEKSITAVHSSGIILSGKADRVEKTPDGKFIIADYKTGRRIVHAENDVDSCMQILLYSFMLKQSGIDISGGEYRYLRDNITIRCEYNDAVEKALDEKLDIFRSALDNCSFPPSGDCTYCQLGEICRKNEYDWGDLND